MHTPVTEQQTNGVGVAAKSVAEHASALARLEIELASLEVKKKVTKLTLGIGLAVGAAIFALLGLGFAFATVAAAFDTFLSTWLSLLIVSAGLVVLTALLAVLASVEIRRGAPPVPEQAIREAKLTTEALRQ
jgi:hypothetical protein